MRMRRGQTLGAEIEAKLAKKYGAPAFAFMPQMNQGTGQHVGRIADAVAFSLWPSRGLDLYGFEIKVSRSDLASEIKNPAKAEAIQRYCDFWFLVTPAGLTSDMDFIPATWGLIEADGTGLKIKKQAPRLTPEALTKPAIASMFRAFHDTVPYLKENFVCVDDLKARIDERAAEVAQQRHRDRSDELERLKRVVQRFEEASGVKIENEWSVGNVGKVVRYIVDAHGPWQFDSSLANEARRLREALAAVEAAREAFREQHQNEVPA
jgi:hypothetical protein